MKSLGDTLKTAREERGITMDQAVHETNISRNYLEALEAEEFEEFPAEAYLVGFLRNYSDFLGLDPDKIVGQFKNYKLSEEPTPIEELVGPPKGSVAKKVLPWIFAAAALGALGVFGVPRAVDAVAAFRSAREERAAASEETVEARDIRPAPPLWEGEVRPGDTLILVESDVEFRFEVGDEAGRVSFSGSTGQWSILLGEEIYIPGAAGRPAWRLYLRDAGLPGGGAIVEIQQLVDVNASSADEGAVPDSEPPSGDEERKRDPVVITSAPQTDRFTLDIAFRDFCLFRYEVDGQDAREAYYADGDDFRLDVGRSVTFWASNAGALYAKIGGTEVPIGRRGEVVVGQIRWIRSETDGTYDLTLVPLY